MRLRSLLLLGYATVIAILLVSGAVVASSARTKMKATIDRDAVALAGALMDEIDLVLGERVHVLQASVGVSEDLRREIERSNDEFDAMGSLTEIESAIDAADAAWRAAQHRPPTPAMQRILDSETSRILSRTMDFHTRTQGEPVFAEIFVTNRYGANVGQTGRTEDYRQNDEKWWRSAWERGMWMSHEVTYDQSAEINSVDIGVRMEDSSGRRIGVLKAVMRVDAVNTITQGFGERSRLKWAVVELLDANGRLIRTLSDDTDLAGDIADSASVRALPPDDKGTIVEQTPRGEMLSAYVRSRTSDDGVSPGWTLILNQPTANAYDPVDDMTRRMLIIGLVGASLAVIVGLLIAGSFGRMTRRLQATSDALRSSEAYVRSIVTSAVDGIITADAHGRIETFNPAAERMFRRSADDVIGKNLTMLMPETFALQHDGFLARYRETGEARVMGSQVEVAGLRADGSEFLLDLTLGEMREGGTHRYVGVLRDATERHDVQHALEAAKETAESASQSKSQFLANMSHELRTPLNAIIGYSEMVIEELQDAPHVTAAQDVGKIRSAGLSLLGLIDQILDLSKVEAGRLEAYAEPFDLNEALDDIVTTILPLIRKRENTIHLDAPAELGVVSSDATKVRQILLNLLSNAAKFTQCGTVALTARREEGDPHDWMVFTVHDDGIGMTPEELDRIWDAFAQADASTTRRYGGTGLGLTITRKFAELLGGSVDVISQPGAGTTFTVRLPAPEPRVGDTAPEAPTSSVRERPVAVHAADRPTVVVIDDDEASRDLVRRFLTSEGFDVVEATCGEDGLGLVRQLRPAAIVLDVLMPGMDGWSVLAALRKEPIVGSTPVVMLTISEQRDLGFALGVNAYLSKPVSRESLAMALAPFLVSRHPPQH